MLRPNEIADRLHDLARKAAALDAAIQGMMEMDLNNEDTKGGVSDLAWAIRDEANKLADEVCPNDNAKLKAVAS